MRESPAGKSENGFLFIYEQKKNITYETNEKNIYMSRVRHPCVVYWGITRFHMQVNIDMCASDMYPYVM